MITYSMQILMSLMMLSMVFVMITMALGLRRSVSAEVLDEDERASTTRQIQSMTLPDGER